MNTFRLIIGIATFIGCLIAFVGTLMGKKVSAKLGWFCATVLSLNLLIR